MLSKKENPLDAMKYPFINKDIYKLFIVCISLWVDLGNKAQQSTSEPARNIVISFLKIKKGLHNKSNTEKVTDFRTCSKTVEPYL